MSNFQRIKKYLNEPTLIHFAFGRRVLQAARIAAAERLPAVADVNEVVFSDEVDPNKIPKDSRSIARRLFFNRLGLAAATAIDNRTRIPIVVGSFVISLIVMYLTYKGYSSFGAGELSFLEQASRITLGATLAIAGAWITWLSLGVTPNGYLWLMPREIITEADITDAKDFARRVLINDHGHAPDDLNDLFRPLTIDAEGRAVDGQVIPSDLTDSYLLKSLRQHVSYNGLIGSTLLFIGVAIAALAYWPGGIIAGVATFLSGLLGAILFIMAIVRAFMMFFTTADSATKRAYAAEWVRQSAPLAKLVAESGEKNFQQIEAAKQRQIAEAARDKTAFIELGKSIGLLAERRDPFAPSIPGMSIGLSVNDLSTHLIVLGDTGTGKTSGVLRPIIKAWTDAEAGGLVVLDGKGVLPAELDGLPEFQIINPLNTTFNPIQNLEPDEVADSISGMMGSADSKDFFELSATKLIRAGATVLRAAATLEPSLVKYNLASLYNLTISQTLRAAAKVAIHNEDDTLRAEVTPVVARAWTYLTVEFPALPDRTRGSIIGNATVWLSAFVDNEALAHWADADDGLQIESALEGARIGVLLPEAEFGSAGAAIANLCKRRLYRALKMRGDRAEDEQRVLLVVDECQEIITQDDTAMLPIARSLGLHAVFSTQNIDGIVASLGGSQKLYQAEQLLGQFKSMVALSVSTDATRQFVSSRMGVVPRAKFATVAGTGLDSAGMAMLLKNPAGGFAHDTAIGRVTTLDTNTATLRRAAGGAANAASEEKPAGAGMTVGAARLITPDEVGSITAEPDTALVAVMRCRVPRRDLVRLSPIYDFKNSEA